MKFKPENTQTNTSTAVGSQEQQWLTNVLLHRGEQITRRFAYFYEKLQALPRTTRKTLQKRLAMTLAGAALLLALSGTPSVHAATISVSSGARGIQSNDGCSLVEAIITANTAGTSGDCNGGTAGPDIITLAGGTYYYKYAYSPGNALPVITSEITIDANGATIERDGGAVDFFRILQVDPSGSLTLNNASLRYGDADLDNGGAIYNQFGATIINDSTISGNAASNGGGVYNLNGTVVLNNSTVIDNQALDVAGAGILNVARNPNTNANVTVNNSSVTGNKSFNGVSSGSGIYNWGDFFGAATAVINNSTISGNLAGLDGGGIVNYGGNRGTASLSINGSSINGNIAGGNGGAIFNSSLGAGSSATATINNSTISGNGANSGGGIYSDGGSVTLTNSTITDNGATAGAGGIVGTTSVMNSIVALQNAGAADCSGAVTSQGYNIESGTTCGFTGTGDQQDVLDTALHLGGLGMNGGTTQTHALILPSVAIEAIPIGPNCDGTGVDQRGGARAQGTDKGGAACDIGAFESASIYTPTAVSLQSFTVTGGSESGLAPALLGLLTSAGLGGLWWRKRRADQPDEG